MKFTLTIPKDNIDQTKQKILKKLQKGASFKGFRKGKAPLDVVEEKTDTEKLNQLIIEEVLPPAYRDYISDNDLTPITDPQISLRKMDDESWDFEIEIVEKPEVKLNNYQDAVKAATAKGSIWTPDKKGDKEPSKEEKEAEQINQIIQALLETVEVEVPKPLINQAVDRRLSDLVDQTNQLGMSVESYLKSRNTSADEIKKQYAKQAEESYQLDFTLDAIAEDLNITISDQEVDAEIERFQNPQLKEAVKQNQSQKEVVRFTLLKQAVVKQLQNL